MPVLMLLLLGVIIHVTDGANPVNPLTPPSTVSIPEDETKPGVYTALYTVAAYNPNGLDPLECSITCVPACTSTLDVVNGENGCIIVSQDEINFDTASISSWSVTVKIDDSGSSDTLTLAPFTVEITGVNDERPYFTVNEKIPVILNDGVAAGATVYQVLTTDVADPDNDTSALVYWLEGEDAKFFKLSTDQVNVGTPGPTILTAVEMDYDDVAMRSLEVYLRVSDKINDENSLSSTQYPTMRVPVNIQNLNDLPLICYSSVVRYIVRDGWSGSLARVECLDPDRLSFQPGCSLVAPNSAFSVVSATGSAVADYIGACEISYTSVERDDANCAGTDFAFCFTLQVTDWADPAGTQNTQQVEVVVEVEAYDDGGVHTLSDATTSFSESDTVGTTCKQLRSIMSWSDTEEDFDHFWSFSPSDDPFVINARTGDLCLNSQIDYEQNQEYVLTVNVVRDAPSNVFPNIPGIISFLFSTKIHLIYVICICRKNSFLCYIFN
ncbi:uncharacterized protein LOC142352904 [Convolutriloba macropyga]|uniref:uncharacterized protein LOC142352904 n=1 Tax=Convolutriloba macropyga TaxID=536237 RepID=UPI003F51CE2A